LRNRVWGSSKFRKNTKKSSSWQEELHLCAGNYPSGVGNRVNMRGPATQMSGLQKPGNSNDLRRRTSNKNSREGISQRGAAPSTKENGSRKEKEPLKRFIQGGKQLKKPMRGQLDYQFRLDPARRGEGGALSGR